MLWKFLWLVYARLRHEESCLYKKGSPPISLEGWPKLSCGTTHLQTKRSIHTLPCLRIRRRNLRTRGPRLPCPGPDETNPLPRVILGFPQQPPLVFLRGYSTIFSFYFPCSYKFSYQKLSLSFDDFKLFMFLFMFL